MIPTTLNVISIELYNSGISDAMFHSKLKDLLAKDDFNSLLMVGEKRF